MGKIQEVKARGLDHNLLILMVPIIGIEPTTFALRMRKLVL